MSRSGVPVLIIFSEHSGTLDTSTPLITTASEKSQMHGVEMRHSQALTLTSSESSRAARAV